MKLSVYRPGGCCVIIGKKWRQRSAYLGRRKRGRVEDETRASRLWLEPNGVKTQLLVAYRYTSGA